MLYIVHSTLKKRPWNLTFKAIFHGAFLLPNGSGFVANIAAQDDFTDGLSCKGVFAVRNNYELVSYSTQTRNGYDGFTFDLSKASSIYGQSSKVQPRSYYVLMIIKSWHAWGWTLVDDPKIGFDFCKLKLKPPKPVNVPVLKSDV